MLTIRRANDRGHADYGWLDTHYSFSFAGYYDPEHMGFRSLRVINDDVVGPGGGFDTHGHRDMEILTYVLDGALEHRDSMGNGSVIRPGEVQRMSAGTGVLHSEFNGSTAEPVHLLQIWILPERPGIAPGYEQKTFSDADKRGRLRLVASRDGRDGSVTIHQDGDVYAGVLTAGDRVEHMLEPGRGAWVHVATGSATINGTPIRAGDGVAVEDEPTILLESGDRAEVLLFDLA
jgi:quercetin 2,3-dioxygenase